jgi:prefoldin subunit 5
MSDTKSTTASPIDSAISSIDSELADLSEQIERLAIRIAPVLVEDGQVAQEASHPRPEFVGSSLTKTLDQLRFNVTQLTSRIASINNRVEL